MHIKLTETFYIESRVAVPIGDTCEDGAPKRTFRAQGGVQ
jgi:hypothetical protein